MSVKSLNQAVSSAFALPDSQTKTIKAAIVGLCSEADRFFRLSFNLDIYSQVTEKEFYEIKGPFPNFRKLTLEQFNRLLFTFVSIRDVSAHLFLNKPIYLDDDIKEFICDIINPRYSLTNGRETTVFGVICVALLFSQLYLLWPFISKTIRHKIFGEITKESLVELQQLFQNNVKPLVSTCKPIYPEEHPFMTMSDVTYFIEVSKETLTKILFDLELYSTKKPTTKTKVSAFKGLLAKYNCLNSNPELMERIAKLRNYWLHGYRLFDQIKDGNEIFSFDLNFIFDILFDVKEAFLPSNVPPILNDINDFGSSAIYFYALRVLELSYKLLDSNIFDPEKAEKRVRNIMNAYSRCMLPDGTFFTRAQSLLTKKKLDWYLSGSKFQDLQPRIILLERIEIFEFSSKKGFDIGEHHVDADELVVANIKCPIKRMLPINGKLLNEYKLETPDKYGIFDIYRCDL